MRFVVLLFGIVAVIITGSVGWFYFEDSLPIIVRACTPDSLKGMAAPLSSTPSNWQSGDIGVFVLLSGAYGLLGVLFAFARCGWQGALLMIVPPLTTAFMNPYSLAFTAPQIFVGLLAFFVFRLPLPSPKANRDDEDKPRGKRNDFDMEDEWSGRGKSAPSSKYAEFEEEESEPPAKPKAKNKRKEDRDE
jgi:hypothetical protein